MKFKFYIISPVVTLVLVTPLLILWQEVYSAINTPINNTASVSTEKWQTHSNPLFGIKINYSKDWTYEETGYDDLFPGRIFNIIFYSPFQALSEIVSVSISSENLNPVTITLEEYKNRILTNLRNSDAGVKNITVSVSALGGTPAYRIEHVIWLFDHWEKSISVYATSNGTLHSVSVLAQQAGIDRYSEDIQKMMESVKFG